MAARPGPLSTLYLPSVGGCDVTAALFLLLFLSAGVQGYI